MDTLRLTQTVEDDGNHHVDMVLEDDGIPRQTASASFAFTLTAKDQEDLRWYLEDYLQYPFDPAPTIAARVERRIADIGQDLFRALFHANEGSRALWNRVRDHLSEIRLEVACGVQDSTLIPWELLHDPQTNTSLALSTRTFVRTTPAPPQQGQVTGPSGPVRILLVICRPDRHNDVPFRSVASRLIKGMSERDDFQLDVLRPPTFAHLKQKLLAAQANGTPYHVVHFDGHGIYGDPIARAVGQQPRKLRGYLLFENAAHQNNQEFVHGTLLGRALTEAGVPLLVLNACRSAHMEPLPEPGQAGDENQSRVFGSLAQEVMDAGVTGVVAMRYNVYVMTAAQFVANLYAALVQGASIGEAVTWGRKQLVANPERHIAGTIALQDWMVPLVYEVEPIQLFAPSVAETNLTLSLRAADATPADITPRRGMLDEDLPPAPEAGFYGRDETLLALDRAFDQHHVVLLHAYAGSGKTTTAAEFARWYVLTGGVDGPVLWTSFEHYKPLVQLLDQMGRLFDPLLQQNGIQWDALTEEMRKRNLVLQILKQVPVLWVWDNIEPVAGFPTGTSSAWTAEEQRELLAFLRDTRSTQAKFVLTSRRKERGWLGDLPVRVELPPMPMSERRQLAEALAAKQGVTLHQVAWRPLLVYSEGNPLTLTVVLGQALRDNLRTAKQIEDYVQRLRAGEAAFDDDTTEGRSRSLSASLDYGFATAFTEQERAILALLHHFQGFVNVGVLQMMGKTSVDWHVPALTGLTRERGIELLDRAAEVGLLVAEGGSSYSTHPALPWFFRQLYHKYYPDDAPIRACVGAISSLGNYYYNEYNAGNREVIAALQAEEANFLYAERLAQQHGWYRAMISAIQGLRALYSHTGRRSEWRQLVAEVTPTFVDLATNGPQPGREEWWLVVMDYRVQLLYQERQWAEGIQLQGLTVDYIRQQAEPLLALPLEQLDDDQRHTLAQLAIAIEWLGHLQREQGAVTCVDSFEESYELGLRIGNHNVAAAGAFNLGHAYLGDFVPALRDLAQAEQWYRRSMELHAEQDRLGRGMVQGQIGSVAHHRYREAQQLGQPNEVAVGHLNAALQAYQEALRMFPSDAINELATCCSLIGAICSEVLPAYLEYAVVAYHEAIRYNEQAGDLFSAARNRENVALAYAQVGRFEDALLFTRAALRTFEQCGSVAAERVARAQQNITWIEEQAAHSG